MGKQSQLLLQPTEVELGLNVGVEFDNSTLAIMNVFTIKHIDFEVIFEFFI